MPLETIASDSLESYSGLSLFARTFASLPNPPRPYDHDDCRHSHDFLKSMPLGTPDKFIEQAKEIVDNSLELVNLDMSISDAKVMENPRERRPALGRKRARFSLKPNSSQPTVNLESSLDVDKLKDPEEFFMAFERFENAKREIQKQTAGVMMNFDVTVQSVASRPRRPGILRRSVKYKHRYSTAKSPVESFEEDILSPLCGSQQEKSDLDAELEDKELTGVVTHTENRVNELLDHLLTSNYDGDEAVSLLREHLQIKPIDLEKSCLPDLQDIRRVDLKASREHLTKPRNSILDLMKAISKRTPERKTESSVHHLASPTPPRSPLASLLLKKQLLHSSILHDPFSGDDIDRSRVRNASPMESISEQCDQVDVAKDLNVSHNNDRRSPQQQAESSAHNLASPSPLRNPLASISLWKRHILPSDPPTDPFSIDTTGKSPGKNAAPTGSINKQPSQVDVEKELNMSHLLRSSILEANQIGTANGSSQHDESDFAGLFDKFVNDNARRFDSGINFVSTGSQADLENKSLSRPEVDANSHTIKPNEFGGRVEDIPAENIPPEVAVSAQIQLNLEGPTIDNWHPIQRESDEANPAMDEDQEMDGSLRAAESCQELHENKKGKTEPRPRQERKRKALSQRRSLAGSGTAFDAEGRRRSTRIRSRPLEFWKGERFLYGRIHSTLSTVIGIKYESPGKADGENPTLKVKSFVSDEYKDLVELAARF